MNTCRFTRWSVPQMAVLALGSASFLAMGPAAASPAPAGRASAAAPAGAVPDTATASASARLLGVTVAQVVLPDPLGGVSAADVDVAPVAGSLGTGAQRVIADAANLNADAIGIDLSGILSAARQVAPPDNATPSATQLGVLPAAPLLTAGISTSTAHARLAADGGCPAPDSPLSRSTTTTTDVSVLAIPDVGTLLNVPGTVSTEQAIRLPATGGPGDVRAVSSSTTTNLAALSLFGSVGVGVSSPPRLTATASGRPGGAVIDYSQPVVTITAPGAPGSPFVLDAANETATFALPENPLLQVELSLGTATRAVAGDGTSATGQAALLHLRVSALATGPLPGLTVAEIDVAPMAVAASAPAGGVICAAPPVVTDGDGDGLSDAEEAQIGTDPTNPDSDGDGLGDGAEVNTHGTDPLDPDTDNGGVNDGTEVANGTNPVNNPDDDTPGPGPSQDSDGDGLTDAQEGQIGTDPTRADTDGDGLGDGAEVNTHGTDPLDPDTDNGGVNDGIEVAHGTNPVDNPTDDAQATPPADDPDGDGLTTGEEILAGTDPAMADTDGDGLSDGLEVGQSDTDPTRGDTDRDGLTDGQEVNGFTIHENFLVCGQQARKWITVKTNARRKDTDRDGLRDRREANGYRIKQRVVIKGGKASYVIGRTRTNPTRKDTDRDGLRDKVEKSGSANKRHDRHKSDPTACDTDRGGINDGVEVKHHSDPSDVVSNPGDRGTIPLRGGDSTRTTG